VGGGFSKNLMYDGGAGMVVRLVERHKGAECGGQAGDVLLTPPHHAGRQARQRRVPHTVGNLQWRSIGYLL
jgi:hypothetical protein